MTPIPRYVSSVDPLYRRLQGKIGPCGSRGSPEAGGSPPPATVSSRWRRRRPEGWSRAARSRLRSGPGSRRKPSHDGACDILLFRRSSELIKTFRTGLTERGDAGLRSRAGSGPRQHSLERVGNEYPGANQCHHRCDHFEHRKHPLRPARSKRRASPHSQKDFGFASHNRWRLRIFRNRCAKSGQARVARVAQKQRLIYHRDSTVKPTPFPPCSPCGIFGFLMRRRAASTPTAGNCLETGRCPVEW